MMHRADFEEHVGAENICNNFAVALERARKLREIYILESQR
jgi:hypothetical protein